MKRRCVIAGNWKMHKTISEGVDFAKTLAPLVAQSQADVYIAVPFTAVASVASASPLAVGGQNMSDAAEGAFTGEVSGGMLIDAGARFVLLGHSERRHLFGESSDLVNRKLHRAFDVGLEPIVCIGETLIQRDDGKTEEVLREQLLQSMAGIDADQIPHLIVAYEPVWAIGTGKTATPEMAQDTHAFIRSIANQFWGSVADKLVIQYGGSVKPDNAATLLSQPDIDGVLVGGASLSVDSFHKIIESQGDL